MTASELIRRLEALIKAKGDCEVKVLDGDEDWPINGSAAVFHNGPTDEIVIDLTA